MLTADQQLLIEQYLDSDPVQVALKTGDRVVAEQIASLQKSRAKIPAFFDARCYILPLSYEQSTSEIVALSRDIPQGELAIDLTCGLGVDSYALAQRFAKVITCEIDPQKAQIAQYNFAKLNIKNVEVRNCSAEELLETFDAKADIVFCDPARRSVAGKKVHAITDCSPNVVELIPKINQITQNVMVKLSPLFDVDELFNIFGQNIEVETVSLNNECKEVVLRMGNVAKKQTLSNTIIRDSNVRKYFFNHKSPLINHSQPANYRYLHIPDVGLMKARVVEQYMAARYSGVAYDWSGYLFTEEPLEGFDGRSFDVSTVMPYKPKQIKQLLRERGVDRASIFLRDFPYPLVQIARQIGVREGGEVPLFFTRLHGEEVICL